jgi:hypothetical protein
VKTQERIRETFDVLTTATTARNARRNREGCVGTIVGYRGRELHDWKIPNQGVVVNEDDPLLY